MDDAERLCYLALRLGEELEVIGGLVDEDLAVFGIGDDAVVLGHGDVLVGLQSLDQQGVEDHGGAESVHALLRGVGDDVGAGNGAVLGRNIAS